MVRDTAHTHNDSAVCVRETHRRLQGQAEERLLSFKDPSGFLAGTVRPLVTYAMVGVSCYLTVMGALPADKFWEGTIFVAGFWFGSRGVKADGSAQSV